MRSTGNQSLPATGSYALVFAFAFWAAQRRLTASAMRARPSGDRFRFFFAVLVAGAVTVVFAGRPRRIAGATEPLEAASRAFACCKRAISASSSARIFFIVMREVYAVVLGERAFREGRVSQASTHNSTHKICCLARFPCV